jgi:tetratricopeptide (TPR) repeat protein
MGNETAKVVTKLRRSSKPEPLSVVPKRASVCQRPNIKTVQNVLLIWLDTNIDEENNADCRDTVALFRHVANNINTFTDSDQCIEFINTIDNNNSTACMIISGSLGQQIMSRVHNMSQVDSIFIFCSNKQYHEQWTKDWFKIKGVFTEVTPICEAVKKAAQQCELNAIPISFMATDSDVSKKNLDQHDCSFMYTQILIDILSTIKFEEKHIKEFIKYCREQFAGIEQELINVKELEKKYHSKTPIWWYSSESFVYPMLNSALRLMNVEIVMKMGFFMYDVHHHIEQLHAEQFNGHQSDMTFTVYRGQGMSTEHFEQMKKTKGGLMAFNNFLSTSKNRDFSLPFALNNLANPSLVGILFVMAISPTESTTPFASIKGVSCVEDREDEVLFSMHAVFRIRDIKPMGGNHRLYQVDLTLTSDNDEDLCRLTNRIREATEGSTGWDQLGELLLKISQAEKAQQVYEILLKQATNENENAHIYDKLGSVKLLQGEYKEALTFYEKSLLIRRQLLSANDLDLAKSYCHIGLVYYNMAEYSKTLSFYEKSSEIQQQSLPPNHPDLASTYNNIGSVYSKMGEYSKALSSYQKALEIKQKLLPSNHPDLAKLYDNIGLMYKDMSEYRKAISFHEKALEIQRQSLPPNHPSSAASYNNLGWAYENMGNNSKACSSYERAMDIENQALSSNHAELLSYRNNFDRVKKKL